jgi:hypothetical protein
MLQETECGFVNLQYQNTSGNVGLVENDGASLLFLQSTAVTTRYVTATLTVKNSFSPPQNVLACFLRFSEKVRITTLNSIKEMVSLIKAVFCEAGAESLKVN